MKFAKQIETAASELPLSWRPHLIRYKFLKKSIRLVVDELHSQGLFDEIIAEKHGLCSGQLTLTYIFQAPEDAKNPNPFIQITIPDPCSVDQNNIPVYIQPAIQKLFISATAVANEPLLLKIQLERDSEFFHLLLDELARAATLHDKEQKKFSETIQTLEGELCSMTTSNKNDMYTWRAIFKLYIEASIFQDTNNKAISLKESKRRFQKFQTDIASESLENNLVLEESKTILQHFLAINSKLIYLQYFQSLNEMAIAKILKKHDKRSGLDATAKFNEFAKNNAVFVEGILLSLYQAVQTKLVTIIPQPEDFSCPVCFCLAWKPIRLKCSHLFCVRCLLKAKAKHITNCFICRSENAVSEATADNLDKSLCNFMELNFPREIEEKEHENAMESHNTPSVKLDKYTPIYQRTSRVSNTRSTRTRTRHSSRSHSQVNCIIS
ncbi:SPX domain-containing protein [Phycomyces nitens]|nr:SPX domain-containing protein [Phycomyces nitens]